MEFCFIIPVFNRPDEIDELLQSITLQNEKIPFKTIVIEDGSTQTCEHIVEKYTSKINVTYYLKYNSGPGDSRNFGMKQSKSDYFIILDSDCILSENYLENVQKNLAEKYVDCFGGPDAMLPSFTPIQKAINFAMTSPLTTGGIRGGSEKINKFQPRSFNMGLSKKAFEASNGFGNIHPGEDPDLILRLWKQGFETKLFSNAKVYHKRRINWEKFYIQVTKFGKVRPILNSWHPEYNKFSFFLPTLFVIGVFAGIFEIIFFPFDYILKIYFIYTLIIFIVSSIQNKNIIVGYYTVIAVWKQFFGYGIGFLNSFIKIILLKKDPKTTFPELFFNTK